MSKMVDRQTEFPTVSLIISNFNGKGFLQKCLDSLLNLDYPGSFEIIVIDSGSTDGTIEMVEQEFPEVKLIKTTRVGIGKALNLGLRVAQGEILALDLNNDEDFSPSWLSILVNALLDHPDAGVVGGLRLLYGTKDVVDEAGVTLNTLGIPSSYISANISEIPRRPRKVDYVGAPVFHKEMLNIVGLFDETYTLYAEDEDFCARVKKAGYDVLLIPQAISYHRRSATIGKASLLCVYYERRNHIRFIIKNFRLPQMFLALFWHVLLLTTIEAFMFVPFIKRLSGIKGSRLNFLSQKTTKENFRAIIEAIYWNIRNLKSTIYARHHVSIMSRSRRRVASR